MEIIVSGYLCPDKIDIVFSKQVNHGPVPIEIPASIEQIVISE